MGDIAEVNSDVAVQKALRKLATDRVPTSVSQLVMWRVSGRLDWETIAELSRGLGEPPRAHAGPPDRRSSRGHSGERKRSADVPVRRDRRVRAASGRAIGRVPSRQDDPGVAGGDRGTGPPPGRVGGLPGPAHGPRGSGADGRQRRGLPDLGGLRQVHAAGRQRSGQVRPREFTDGLAEGMLGRLVRAQLVKGPRDKGKVTYGIKIDNASPLDPPWACVAGAREQARGALLMSCRAWASRREGAWSSRPARKSVKAMGLSRVSA